MRLPRVTLLRLAIVVALAALVVWLTDPFADVPDMSPGTTNGAAMQAGGVTMSLRLPRGPYFLGELLPVDVALANHARHPYVTGRIHAQPLRYCPWRGRVGRRHATLCALRVRRGYQFALLAA